MNFSYFRKKIIRTKKFAGKSYRGIAKCDPVDDYDQEKGEELALARCEAKIANKKMQIAILRFNTAQKQLRYAYDRMIKANNYYNKAIHELNEANMFLENIEQELS